MWICVDVDVDICTYVYVRMCMYVCTYIHTDIHRHTDTSSEMLRNGGSGCLARARVFPVPLSLAARQSWLSV